MQKVFCGVSIAGKLCTSEKMDTIDLRAALQECKHEIIQHPPFPSDLAP